MAQTFPCAARLRRSAAIAVAALGIFVGMTAPAQAQWLKYKTPGIPRTADGKPDLSAPAPRMADGKPDFSGLWRVDAAGTAETGKAEDAVKPQPWAAAVAKKRKETIGRDSPSVLCLPTGVEIDDDVGKVVQTPNLLLMLWSGTRYREVFLDGRPLPVDPNPDWMGYSVGHWEGDTLVIESAGFNDKTWLDDDGHPHTERLHVTERLHRSDFGHMEVVRTMVDPGALLQPWTVPVKLELDADTEQLEYVCNENERDHQHLVGKASDEKSVPVDPKLLARYAGTYEFASPTSHQVFNLTFTLDKDHLVFGGMGSSVPLVSASKTDFSGGGATFKFVANESGAIAYALIQTVEGNFKAIRK
jgi:hypothetical protein